MPFTFKSAQKAVAIFLLVGLFFLIAIFILIGKGSDLFTIKDYYKTIFDEGYGLTSGSVIKYKSINIGKVRDLQLTSDDHVEVRVWFNSEYRHLIKKNSVLKIQATFIGSPVLVLVPSLSKDDVQLLPGSLIYSSDMPEGRKILAEIAEQTPLKKDDLTATAQKILNNIDNMQPVINSSLYNLRDTLQNIRQITAGVEEILSNINYGNSSIGALVKDNRELYNKINSMMDSLDATLKSVRSATERPEDMKGIMVLLRENLVELRKVLSGIKTLVGGEKDVEKSIRPGERF